MSINQVILLKQKISNFLSNLYEIKTSHPIYIFFPFPKIIFFLSNPLRQMKTHVYAVLLSQFFTKARWSVPLLDRNSMFLALNLGRGTQMTLRQSSSASFNLQIIMAPADYCALCEFPFKQMGACPVPQKPILYAYISLLPYLIPIFYVIVAIIRRNLKDFKVFVMLASGYVVGDKLCKPLFKSPRPEHSCKSSFGMPSSHMVVIAAFVIYRLWKSHSIVERIFWLAITFLQGVSRIELNYHTLEQVIAGTCFGVVYVLVFEKLWIKISPFLNFLPSKEEERNAGTPNGGKRSSE